MKSPAFQFYPNDWLSSPSIMMMSPAEEGAYIRLLSIAWMNEDCGLPDDDDQLAILSRLGKSWGRSAGKIRACFSSQSGRLYNKRLMEEREKQEAYREKQKVNGQRGGRPKKADNQSDKPEDKKGLGFSGLSNSKPKKSSSSSSSSSNTILSKDKIGSDLFTEQEKIEKKLQRGQNKKVFDPPQLQEVLEYFAELKQAEWPDEYVKLQSEKFFDYYTSNGWRVGKNPMKDWKSSVRNWIKNDFDNASSKNNPNGTGNGQRQAAGPAGTIRKGGGTIDELDSLKYSGGSGDQERTEFTDAEVVR